MSLSSPPCLVVYLLLVPLRLGRVGFECQTQVVYLTHIGDFILLKHPGLPLCIMSQFLSCLYVPGDGFLVNYCW